MLPGGFFSSLMMLCYCVLHVLRHFVHWNCCAEEMCSHLQLVEFEGSLTRKLRVSRKPRTKASILEFAVCGFCGILVECCRRRTRGGLDAAQSDSSVVMFGITAVHLCCSPLSLECWPPCHEELSLEQPLRNVPVDMTLPDTLLKLDCVGTLCR